MAAAGLFAWAGGLSAGPPDYLWAFTRGVRLAAWAPAFIGFALLAAAVLSLLWPGVPAALRALWILASYWAAQWLIASSLLPPRRGQA